MYHGPGLTRRMLAVSCPGQALRDSGTGERMVGLGKPGVREALLEELTFRSRTGSVEMPMGQAVPANETADPRPPEL